MRPWVIVVSVALVAGACSESDEPAGDPPTSTGAVTTVPSPDDAFRAEALATCSELIDDRDHAVFEIGSAASIRVLEMSVTDATPDAAEVTELTGALDAYQAAPVS